MAITGEETGARRRHRPGGTTGAVWATLRLLPGTHPRLFTALVATVAVAAALPAALALAGGALVGAVAAVVGG
ncbi:MAG TPA: hypothetical protein VNT56_03060, partial [Acidimicrobiales bacterium]|nr:hypothetical protein [Acidimicrobiales bacterium]